MKKTYLDASWDYLSDEIKKQITLEILTENKVAINPNWPKELITKNINHHKQQVLDTAIMLPSSTRKSAIEKLDSVQLVEFIFKNINNELPKNKTKIVRFINDFKSMIINEYFLLAAWKPSVLTDFLNTLNIVHSSGFVNDMAYLKELNETNIDEAMKHLLEKGHSETDIACLFNCLADSEKSKHIFAKAIKELQR